MTVETATYIPDLNAALPGASDLKSEGDDHIRLVKTVLKDTLPNLTGAVTATHTQINNFCGGGLAASTVVSGAFGAADAGLVIYATGGITAPNATMAAGDIVTIINVTSSPITITQASGLTMYQAGTANTGNRTLAQRGIATVFFHTASEAYAAGTGLS